MPVLADPTTEEERGLSTLDDDVEQILNGTQVTGNGHSAEAELAEPEEFPLPRPLVLPVLAKRAVRGRYRAVTAGWQVDLRVDVDGSRPTRRLSGDFFSISGATTSYFGSFVVNAPTVTTTDTQVKIEGLGTYTWAAGSPFVRVTIPRATVLESNKPATLQFITPPSTPGASYLCPFGSQYLRTIQWEQDSVAGVVPFVSYNTGSLPQPAGSPARVLTVSQAYAEAGIELQVAGAPNVVPVSAGGSGTAPTWSDSELHNAMANHFSLFANAPQWRVWLLVATAHDEGYRGIMFDASDAFQRQGCAVFYDAIKGTDAASQRAQLRTYVHELGHAFNLLHSWQKNLAQPPAPLGSNGGLGDLSWMNYAWKYQPPPPASGGEPAYWASFPFQFTDNELVHLRHGFYKNIVMGANPFGKGAAEVDPDLFDEPIVDHSGLSLALRSKTEFAYGEPVVVELKLGATDLRGRDTHGYLHPNDDFVNIAIRQPSGRTILYRPLRRRCADESRTVHLGPQQPEVYDSAYIGYGRDGFYFDQPGQYTLRAHYVAADGSRVISPVLRLRVSSPVSKDDERAGNLLLDDEQGKILSLLGSDSETLRAGNEALDTLLDQYGQHPLAVYARLVKGINAERDFKNLTPEKEVLIRKAQPKESIEQLSTVVEASSQDEGIDNITLNMVLRRMAQAHVKEGDLQGAMRVADGMVDIFTSKGLKAQVLQTVKGQAQAVKAAAAEAAGEG